MAEAAWNPDTYLAYDLPSSVAEQLAWLCEAGFDAEASYVRPDLAVFVARRPGASSDT